MYVVKEDTEKCKGTWFQGKEYKPSIANAMVVGQTIAVNEILPSHIYALVVEVLGNKLFKVQCSDGVLCIATVCGQYQLHAKIKLDDYVFVNVGDYSKKCDIIHKYNESDEILLTDQQLFWIKNGISSSAQSVDGAVFFQPKRLLAAEATLVKRRSSGGGFIGLLF